VFQTLLPIVNLEVNGRILCFSRLPSVLPLFYTCARSSVTEHPHHAASVETETNVHFKTIQKYRSISLLRFVELRIKSEKKWLISVINQKHLHAEKTRNEFANQSQYIQIQGDKKGINSSQ
jgi:hypothetical protein